MQREHNWADTYTFKARIHRPGTVDEARRLVAASARVRAIGARHSFNGIADSPGDLVDLGGLEPLFSIDRERQSVTVGAATPYGTLARHLQSEGWALHNMGSLPHISVAGATATGTHGSGDRNGTLSSAVSALEIIGPDGDLSTVRRGDAGFNGMVVGLGAFGVVTRVTLDIQPTFDVRQDAFVEMPWAAALEHLDEIMSAAYSVSMMTSWSQPTIGSLWLKTRVTEPPPPAFPAARFGASAAPLTALSGRPDLLHALNPFGAVGPWSERLAHFRVEAEPGALEQIQSEYMVPRAQGRAALAALHAIGDRIDAHLRLSEIRTMAADDLWLSPSYGHDAIAIHFTWKREPETIAAITREIEDIVIPLGGRPHWGKLMHARAATTMTLYPRMSDFRDLALSQDPDGKFRNAFLDAHVFGDARRQPDYVASALQNIG